MPAGWFGKAAGYVGVYRGNHGSGMRSLMAAGDWIFAETSVMVFAEGTRSRGGTLRPLMQSASDAAQKACAITALVALEGSLEASPMLRCYVCPTTFRILVGEVRSLENVTDRDRECVVGEVRSRVIELPRRLGGRGEAPLSVIVPAGVAGPHHANKPGDLQ